MRRLLRHRVLVYLGVVSCGLHLWSQPLLGVVYDDWLGPRRGLGWTLVLATVGLAITVVVAAVSWYLVERPLIQLSRRPRLGGRDPPHLATSGKA